MASSGQLCTVIARLLGLPEPTLRLHFLNMARAGLRTTGGRGRSAAKMVARDAATLIVAGAVSPAIKDTVETLAQYSDLCPTVGGLRIKQNGEVVASEVLGPTWDLRFMPVTQLASLPGDHTFIDALSAIIEAVTVGDVKLEEHEESEIRVRYWPYESKVVPQLEIMIRSPRPFARIKLATGNFEEFRSYQPLQFSVSPTVDMSSSFTITDRTIFAISKCLRNEPYTKLPNRKKRESK